MGAVEAVNFTESHWRFVSILGFCACLALLVFYVWQVNDLTKGSYLINSYENKVISLSNENKNLQVAFAEQSFLGQALQKAESLHFQKVSSVTYIQIPDNSVATAKK